MRVGVACKPGKFGKFIVGRGMGGVSAAGEWDSQDSVSVCGKQYQMLFLTNEGGNTESGLSSSEQLWLAHNVALCSPVAGGVNITLTVPISFCSHHSLRLICNVTSLAAASPFQMGSKAV